MTKRPSLAETLKSFSEPIRPNPVAPSQAPHVVIPAEPEPKGRAKTRAGMKLLLTPVEPSIHKRLKLLAVQNDKTLEDIARAAFAEYLGRHEAG
jgi:hypothetical protein